MQSEPGENGSCLGDGVMDCVVSVCPNSATRGCCGNAIDSVETGHFFYEVDLALQIDTKAGSGHRATFGSLTDDGKSELPEEAKAVRGRDLDSEKCVHFRVAQGNLLRFEAFKVGINDAVSQLSAGGFK